VLFIIMETIMADEAGSAMSGGLLVILGILVAVGLGIFFFGGKMGGGSGPSVSVSVPAK
jgi:hypothetical protein